MSLLNLAPWWVAALLSALLVAAAVQDVLVRKISNLLVIAVILLGLGTATYLGLRVALWQNAAIFVGLLALGTVAYARHWLGGGDVKLFAAAGLWSDLAGAPRLIAAIFISGGVLALIMVTQVLLRRHPDGARLRDRRSIPYGVAIAAGTLLITWYGRRF